MRAAIAVRVVNQIPAMIAYWDASERCVYSNAAYQDWFGRTEEVMRNMTLESLLGPIYEKNLPYIRAALRGEKQVFERQITLPNGDVRESLATYTPDIVAGEVRGFSVHVADVTFLRRREAKLEEAIQASILVLEKTKRSFRSQELGALRQQLELLQASRAKGLGVAESGDKKLG